MSLITNDTFDDIEASIDILNETKNIEKKINLHKELKEKVQIIEKEIEKFVNIIDEVDIELTHKLNEDNIHENENENENIDSDIIDIDNLMKDLSNEKSFEKMLDYYKNIIIKIRKCKNKCVGSGLNIIECE